MKTALGTRNVTLIRLPPQAKMLGKFQGESEWLGAMATKKGEILAESELVDRTQSLFLRVSSRNEG